MPKRTDINLIPAELIHEKKIEEVRKSFNFVGLGLLIILSLVSLLLFGYRIKLGNDVSSKDKLINREKEKINDLSSIEQDARRLKIKSEAISKIIKNQYHFSILLDILAESTPKDVTITNFTTLGENRIGLSGNAQSYTSLANFILTALDTSYGGKLFNGADLTSVSLDEVTGKAKFTIVYYLKNDVLLRNILIK